MELTNQTITDHAIPLVHRALVVQARELIRGFTPNQKIAAVQILIYQVSKQLGIQYILLVPKKGFEGKFQKVFAIAEFLPKETLLDLAAEILEEPIDENG